MSCIRYSAASRYIIDLTVIGPILWGHSGPRCHALSLSSSMSSWTSMRRLRATVPPATSAEWREAARCGEWAQHFSNASCLYNKKTTSLTHGKKINNRLCTVWTRSLIVTITEKNSEMSFHYVLNDCRPYAWLILKCDSACVSSLRGYNLAIFFKLLLF